MQRTSSITSVSPSDKAIDNTATRKQFRRSRMIGMLLAIISLTSAQIFVDPVAPSVEAHPVCTDRFHVDGTFTGVYSLWRVRRIVYINSNRRVVYWKYQNQGKGPWYKGGSITCE